MVDFASLFSGAGDYINSNPEQFAIMADMIGKNMAPENAFAGVGTAFGQSSLMNKAIGEQRGVNEALIKAIMGGQTMQQQPLSMEPAKPPQASLQIPDLTPAGIDGLSSIKMSPGKPGPDGSIGSNEISISLTKPKAGSQTQSMGDLFSSPF